MTKYIVIFIVLLVLTACVQQGTKKKTSKIDNSEATESKEVEQWTDEHGNVFTEKDGKTFINPAKYTKKGRVYKVFFYNKTSNVVHFTNNLKIQPNEFQIINLKDVDTLELDNGVTFMFGDYGLEIDDTQSQVSGLGGSFLDKYKVPDDAEWAFVIVPPGEGDG